MKNKRRIVWIAAIVFAAVLAVIVAIPFFIDANSFRPKLESELSRSLNRQVKVGNLHLSILSGSVSADDLSIADDPTFSTMPFVTTKHFRAGVEMKPLIFDKVLHVTEVVLDQPQIRLISGAKGTWNFSSIGEKNAKAQSTTPAATSDMSIAKLTVNDGSLLLAKLNSNDKPQVFDKVNLSMSELSLTSQFPFVLTTQLPGGGDANVQGKAGPLNSSNTAATPLQAAIKVNKLDLAASGFVDASTGIAGMADLDGTITSDGTQAKSAGSLTASNLKLSPKGIPSKSPVSVKYGVDHNLMTKAGTITQGDVSMGRSLAHLTGSYQASESVPVLDLKLDGAGMSIDELEAMLPALGIVLPSGSQLRGGTLTVSNTIVGPANTLVITGPVRLSNTKLAGFNLQSKLNSVSALTGQQVSGSDTAIQNLSANMRVAPDGTRANDISLTIPALGVLSGAGTVNPSGALNFKMMANLSGSSAANLTQVAGLAGGGGLQRIPFTITGTTSDPHIVPDLNGVAVGLVTNRLTKQFGGSLPKGFPTNALSDLLGGKKPRR